MAKNIIIDRLVALNKTIALIIGLSLGRTITSTDIKKVNRSQNMFLLRNLDKQISIPRAIKLKNIPANQIAKIRKRDVKEIFSLESSVMVKMVWSMVNSSGTMFR